LVGFALDGFTGILHVFAESVRCAAASKGDHARAAHQDQNYYP